MTRYGQTMAEALKGINEKLKPSDGAGAYVKDFKKSDAPQFKGKSDEKKQKMAIAAYLVIFFYPYSLFIVSIN